MLESLGAQRQASGGAAWSPSMRLALNVGVLQTSISAETLRLGVLVMPSGAVLEGRAPPLHPRALACLVSRDSELAYLLRSLIKLSLPPTRSRACLFRSFFYKQ